MRHAEQDDLNEEKLLSDSFAEMHEPSNLDVTTHRSASQQDSRTPETLHEPRHGAVCEEPAALKKPFLPSIEPISIDLAGGYKKPQAVKPILADKTRLKRANRTEGLVTRRETVVTRNTGRALDLSFDKNKITSALKTARVFVNGEMQTLQASLVQSYIKHTKVGSRRRIGDARRIKV